jgi:hypothetical protein
MENPLLLKKFWALCHVLKISILKRRVFRTHCIWKKISNTESFILRLSSLLPSSHQTCSICSSVPDTVRLSLFQNNLGPYHFWFLIYTPWTKFMQSWRILLILMNMNILLCSKKIKMIHYNSNFPERCDCLNNFIYKRWKCKHRGK